MRLGNKARDPVFSAVTAKNELNAKGAEMKPVNRRSFMKITGSTLGIGVLYSALPTVATGEAGEMIR